MQISDHDVQMQGQYQQFLQFQKFMDMQKTADAAPDGSKLKSTQPKGTNKTWARGGKKTAKGAAAGVSVRAQEDKENTVPEAQNRAKPMDAEAPALKVLEPKREAIASAIMPAGESSCEEPANDDPNDSCDSFDYAQKLVEQEKKRAKKDRKKRAADQGQKEEEPQKVLRFEEYDDLVFGNTQEPAKDLKCIENTSKDENRKNGSQQDNDFEVDFDENYQSSFSCSKIIPESSLQTPADLEDALRVSASPF